MTIGELVYKITGDTSGLKRATTNAEKQVKGLGGSFKKLGALLKTGFVAIAVAGIVSVGKEFANLAADAEETRSKFNTVFKSQANAVATWAQEYSDAVGRSQSDTLGFLATIQDTLVPLGFARERAADFSKEIVTLAGDLASFNNLPTEQVIQDIQSAIVGNTETLRKYGVVASQAAIQQEALNSGIGDGSGQLTAQEKAAAILNLTMKGTTDAQGDLLRTQDSSANVSRRLESAYKDLGITLGQSVNTVFTPFKALLADIVKGTNDAIIATRNYRDQFKAIQETGEATGDLARLNADLETIQRKLLTATQFETQQLLEMKDAIEQAIEAEFRRLEVEDEALILSQKTAEQDRRRAEAAREKAEADKLAADELAAYLDLVGEEFSRTTEGQIQALESEIAMWEEYSLTAVNTKDQVLAILEEKKEALDQLVEKNREGLTTIADLEAEYNEQSYADWKAAQKRKAAEDAAAKQAELDRERALQAAKLDAVSGFFGGFAELAGLGAEQSKSLFALNKALASAEAAINSYKAYTVALASAPPPFNYILAAGTIAAGLAQQAKILGTTYDAPAFENGGIVPSRPGVPETGDNVLSRLNPGELILNQAQQRNLAQQMNGNQRVTVEFIPEGLFRVVNDGLNNGKIRKTR